MEVVNKEEQLDKGVIEAPKRGTSLLYQLTRAIDKIFNNFLDIMLVTLIFIFAIAYCIHWMDTELQNATDEKPGHTEFLVAWLSLFAMLSMHTIAIATTPIWMFMFTMEVFFTIFFPSDPSIQEVLGNAFKMVPMVIGMAVFMPSIAVYVSIRAIFDVMHWDQSFTSLVIVNEVAKKTLTGFIQNVQPLKFILAVIDTIPDPCFGFMVASAPIVLFSFFVSCRPNK